MQALHNFQRMGIPRTSPTGKAGSTAIPERRVTSGITSSVAASHPDQPANRQRTMVLNRCR